MTPQRGTARPSSRGRAMRERGPGGPLAPSTFPPEDERAARALECALMSLQEERIAVVEEHMRSENEHRFDDTLATFAHPRYELIPTGDVYDGPEQVAEYYRA